jgi:hypothetical protein
MKNVAMQVQHAFFVAMMAIMKKRWTEAAVKAALNPDHIETVINKRTTVRADHGAKVIVDDVLLYATDVPTLLKFFAIDAFKRLQPPHTNGLTRHLKTTTLVCWFRRWISR